VIGKTQNCQQIQRSEGDLGGNWSSKKIRQKDETNWGLKSHFQRRRGTKDSLHPPQKKTRKEIQNNKEGDIWEKEIIKDGERAIWFAGI